MNPTLGAPRLTAAMILSGSLVQRKGTRLGVGLGEEALDGGLEGDEGVEHAAFQPPLGQLGEIKAATVRAFHYASADELKRHLHAFLLAYNCARRPKTLRGKTPYEFICDQRILEPGCFKLNPHHHNPGLNS